jgi:YHS domain-containing protein
MKPFEMVHEGQTIKFCCKNCVKDFKADPKKYLTKLAAEVKKQEAAKAKAEKN